MERRVTKVKVSRGVPRTGGGMCGVMRGKVVLDLFGGGGDMTAQCSFILSLEI